MSEIRTIDVKLIAPELGVFFIVSSVVFFVFMNKIRGKLHFIETYIASRDWEFLDDPDKLVSSMGILKFIMVSILFWPLFTLIMWIVTLLCKEKEWESDNGNKYETILGISTFLICSGFFLIAAGIANMKWEKYKINKNSIALITVGFCLYIAFQFIVIFMQEPINFFGISAIFISANGIMILLLIFFIQVKGGKTINDVLQALEWDKDVGSDIKSIFTIPQVGEEIMASAISGGIQAMYTSQKFQDRKKLVILIGYTIAIGILIAYSVIAYYYCEDYKGLGVLNSILIESIDVLVGFYIYSEVSRDAYIPVFLALASRFFIFILTGFYWFIGYTCVYWVFTIILSKHILDKKFPLLNTIAQISKNEVDIGKTNEFTYLLALLIYIILIVAISLGDPTRVPITNFYIQNNEFPLWLIGICAIILSFLYCIMIFCIRLVKRKIRGIRDHVEYFLILKDFDVFWILSLIGIVICWSSGIAVYIAANSEIIIVLFLFLPVIGSLNLGFYANWARNDYSVVKNPQDYNSKVDKKIKQEEEVLEKVRKYQEDFLEKAAQGLEGLPGLGQTMSDMNMSKRVVTKKVTNSKDSLRAKLGLIDISKLRQKIPEKMHDWTAEMNVVVAFFKRRLLKADYINIALAFFSLLSTCVMAGMIYGIDRQMKYGVTAAVILISFSLVFLPLQHNYRTSTPFTIGSYISLSMGTLLNFGYGYIYYHFELKQNSNSNQNGINVLFNTFVIPVFITYAYAIAKLIDDKWKISHYSIVMFVMAQIFSIGCSIIVLIVVSVGAGIALFGFFFIIAVYVAILIKYLMGNFRLPKILSIFTIFLTFIIVVSGIVIGCSISDLGVYAGCSITLLFFSIILIGYSLIIVINSLRKADKIPIFFSPWVFPIYKYSPTKQCIIRYDNMGSQLFIGLFIIIIWSITCVIWVPPTTIGVSVGCLCEVLIALIIVFISGVSPAQLGEALQLMNPEENIRTLKKAWNECKTRFLSTKGVQSAEDFPSYFERYQKLEDIKSMCLLKICNPPRDSENPAWCHMETDMSDIRDVYTEYYIEDTKANDQYIQELELVIHMQLLIVMSSFSSKVNDILVHNNLIVSKNIELKAFGIHFTLEDGGKTLAERHSHVVREIAKLDHVQRSRFENIKEQYLIELEEQRIRRKEQEAKEKQAEIERMENMKNLHEQRQQKMKEQANKDVPIDEMIDSKEKYAKIIAECKVTGKKFEDKQFPPTEKSLGPKTIKNTTGWKRAEGCVLYEGGVSPSDVKQGAIGDCYYLSAISVLGEKRLKEIFVNCDPDPQCGAYLMRFFKYGDPVYVIVDDYFPTNNQEGWAFAQTVSGKELWPMLLEKAYAKLHDGYDNIVAGKVHYALADLTGGQPEEIRLESLRENSETLWNKLIKYEQGGYPMGAGSPENPNGDLAVSENGIVQGHAYSILNVEEIDGEKILQMKNPHGQYGQEWRGDWGDGSSKWTKKAITKLGYDEKPDGIFWISLEDFVWEFKNLYVCRIFDDPKWKKLEVQGEWVGSKAAGFPCKDNPKAKVENNPQYLLTVTKQSTVFISLTQKNAIDMFKGKSPILFLVFAGNKKVSDISKNMVGSSGKPIDLRIISNEMTLDKGNNYVILVTAIYEGERGTGGFEVNVMVDDLKATITEIT